MDREEEKAEGRGEKWGGKGKLSDLLKVIRSLQDQHGWAQRWMTALGLSAKKMPPLLIRRMCISHQEAKHCFPFKTGKKVVVATGLGCAGGSNLDQPVQNRASRKVLFLCGENNWKRKLFQYRDFLYGWDAIPPAEWAKPSKKARVDLLRNIIQKKNSEPFQPWQLTVQLKGKKQSYSVPPLRIVLQLWFLGGPHVTVNKVKEVLRLQRSETVWATLQPCVALCGSLGPQQTDRQTCRLRSMDPQGFSKAAVVQAPCEFRADFSVPLPCNSLFMEFLPWGKWVLLQSQKVIFAQTPLPVYN